MREDLVDILTSFLHPTEAKVLGPACRGCDVKLSAGGWCWGTLSLPQGVLGGAEVQRGQALVAPQVGVSPVLQQQLNAVGVPAQAGFVQGPAAVRRQVRVSPPAEEVAEAGGVTQSSGQAQRGGQLPLVLQRPQPCGEDGAGLMPGADPLGTFLSPVHQLCE